MPRVIHFELHAEDPERAAAFYETVFGWEFTKWEGPQPYWMIKTGPEDQKGINGGMIPRQGAIDGEAVVAYVCTVDVSSVDEYGSAIESRGGTIVVPKFPISGMAWMAYAKDTEGNIFGIFENDPSAK